MSSCQVTDGKSQLPGNRRKIQEVNVSSRVFVTPVKQQIVISTLWFIYGLNKKDVAS